MTDAAHAAQNAKTYVGYAKDAADKLKGWHEEASKLANAGTPLNEFEQIMKDLTWTSKLSAGLGIASFAISAISAFLPIPSTEQKIYDAVNQLSQQVADLKTGMETAFAELETKLGKDAVKIILGPHIEDVRNATNKMAIIAGRRKKDKDADISDLEADLRKINPNALTKAIDAIEHALTTDEADENLLDLTFDLSYADPREILRVGAKYQAYAVAALSAYTAVKMIAARDAAGGTLTQAETNTVIEHAAGDPSIAATPSAQLAAIAAGIKAQLDRCYDRKQRADAVERYFVGNLEVLYRPVMASCQGYSDTIVEKLHARFPYLNFTVLVYWGYQGAQRHGWYVEGTEYGLIERKLVDFMGTKATDPENLRNLFIYFAPRSIDGTPPLHKLPKLSAPSKARKSALTALSSLANTPKRGGIFKNTHFLTRWHRVHVNGSLTDDYFKTQYKVFAGRAAKGWENGDFVWGCYTIDADLFVPVNTIDPKTGGWVKPNDTDVQKSLNLVMGLTSQNRVGLVSTHDNDPEENAWTVDCEYYQFLVIWDDQH